jgi:hypothetical protein
MSLDERRSGSSITRRMIEAPQPTCLRPVSEPEPLPHAQEGDRVPLPAGRCRDLPLVQLGGARADSSANSVNTARCSAANAAVVF